MRSSLKRVMYLSAVLDTIPWLLFGFTGVYTRIYIARNVDVDFFALSGMVDTLLGIIVLQFIAKEETIRFISRNVVLISFVGSMLDIGRALLLPVCPAFSLVLGGITSTVFFGVVSYGFLELANNLYADTDRTVYRVTCDKFGKIASFAAMLLAFFLKDLPIDLVVTVLVVSNIIVFGTDFLQYKLFKHALSTHKGA